MRLRTKVSCAIITGLGMTSLAAFAAGCVGDDNATPAVDSGLDSTVNEPETSTPTPDASEDAGPGTDSAPTNQDAGDDAGDSAIPDTGVDAGCAPALPGAWQPPAYVPAIGRYTSHCDNGSSQVDGYWTACLGDAAAPAACAAFADASALNADCAPCLVTPEDAGAYGAAVVRGVPVLNLAGCIQIADTSDAGLACATAVQATEACAEAACRASCALTSDPASVAAYVACTKAATASTACSTWATPAQGCVSAEQEAGVGEITNCFAATAEQEFDDIGVYFCGS